MLVKRVVLTGFMGSGKSTIGRRLAAELGWEFVDTDALVVTMAGRTIADLFADGEAHFRRFERQAIGSLLGRERVVVSVGGGAIAEEETRALMAALGPAVWLDAPIDELWRRCGRDPSRPLALDEATFRARYAARRPLYARVPLRVDTAALGPDEAARHVAAVLRSAPAPLDVALGERSYPIHVGPGVLSALPSLMGKPGRCLIVTDETVAGLYAEPVLAALSQADWEPRLAVVPAGEGSKSLAEAGRLYDAAVEAGLKRHHPIVALGGGVVGDLAGFIAATYQRGVPFVQVPTTLLAQIDSSVGGKVAINHPSGKNLIGAFYQPRLVLADTATLLTLPEREYLAGLGEMVKYGVIMDAAFFARLESEVPRLLARDLPLLNELVRRCCELKAEVVQEDERETAGGRRAILNFGHTVGHAIEAIAGYGTVLHGEAVAIGMVAEGRLAVRRGLWADAEQDRLERLVAALGLRTELPDLDGGALLTAMGRDKKNLDKGITFVLPTAIGEVVVQAMGAREVEPVLAHQAT
jgi:3-dehydroquinate synthase